MQSLRMKKLSAHAELFIDDVRVGEVELRGMDTSWSFGQFKPFACFSKFAPYFGQWSMLMHEDEKQALHEAASEELRRVEYAIDRLKIRMFFPEDDKWVRVTQVNIDGPMIEWKAY
ncbi:hypothetical protein BH10PLA1_BH10PLA1_05900 [soil metagenome]